MNPHRSGKQMACWLGCLPAPPLSIVKETASAQCSSSGELDRGSVHVLGRGADSPSDQPVFSNNAPRHPPHQPSGAASPRLASKKFHVPESFYYSTH